MHSTVTQKQSFDSMTLSRGHSFKTQSSKQYKLKSNLKHKTTAAAMIQCQQNTDSSNEQCIKSTSKNIIFKLCPSSNQSHESVICASDKNSNECCTYATTNTPKSYENPIQSTELTSLAPNLENNNRKIHLTITPMHMNTTMRRTKTKCYNKIRRTTKPTLFRSWFNWLKPKKNTAFYSPPLEHPIKNVKINLTNTTTANTTNAINSNCNHTIVKMDSMSSNDEEISNSSLQNANNQTALKDELAAYMDEIRAREKR